MSRPHSGIRSLDPSHAMRLTRGVVLVAALGAAVGLVITAATGDWRGVAATLATLVVLLFLRQRLTPTRLESTVLATVGSVYVFAVYMVLTSERGTVDPTALLFPTVMVIAGLLLDRSKAAAVMALVTLTMLAIAVSETTGVFAHPASASVSLEDVLAVTTILSTTGILTLVLSENMFAGLRKSLESQRSYTQIFDATTEGIVLLDHEGRVLDENHAARQLLRAEDGELRGRHLADWLETDDLRGRLLAARSDQPQLFELALAARDDERWIEISLRNASIIDRPVLLAVMRDRTESRALRHMLHESDKLSTIGQLARGVAHDFNNQLTGILGSASLVRRECIGKGEVLRHLEVIEQAARRSADLARQLLDYSRQGKQESTTTDLRQLVDDTIALLERSFDKSIVIEQERCAHPVVVIGDPSQLQNAILNLALNARNAMPNGGRIRFVSGIDDSGAGESLSWIRVIDTGIGMDEHTKARIFEPFFTTRETGNGMGLAAVNAVVEDHGGYIDVVTAPGEGSTFTIYLPYATKPGASPAVEQRKEPDSLPGARVLIVEDEPTVAATCALLLEAQGCTVETASSGTAALQILQQATDAFDVILLDQDLPGRRGSQVLADLGTAIGNVPPVVAMSAYAPNLIRERMPQARSFLSKPFDTEALVSAIAEALRSAP